MTRDEVCFEDWFDNLCLILSGKSINFRDADSVRDDYEAGRDVFDVADEIAQEDE